MLRLLLNRRSKEIRNYCYLPLANGDCKAELRQHFWLSVTEAAQSLWSLWSPFPHAGISISASVFWNWLRNLSIWKLIQGGKKPNNRVFISATSSSWFAGSLAGWDWASRTEEMQCRNFGWNYMKSQEEHLVTSKRQCGSPESTDVSVWCKCHQPPNPAKVCCLGTLLWATQGFLCVGNGSQKYMVELTEPLPSQKWIIWGWRLQGDCFSSHTNGDEIRQVKNKRRHKEGTGRDGKGRAQPVQWDDALHQDYGKSFFQEERQNYRDILQG